MFQSDLIWDVILKTLYHILVSYETKKYEIKINEDPFSLIKTNSLRSTKGLDIMRPFILLLVRVVPAAPTSKPQIFNGFKQSKV